MYRYVKKIMDIIIATILLLLLIPAFIVIAVIIKLDSPGPVIFSQYRVGKNKELFKLYKFRTMHAEAPESLSTNEFKGVDMYITKRGRILRRTSLDELPQLVNILLGQMSIVGPRPTIPEEKKLMKKREQYKVYDVLPGVTGWAQINGRDLVTEEQKAIMDGKYVKEMSLSVDIKIILQTITAVIKGEGFYEGARREELTRK